MGVPPGCGALLLLEGDEVLGLTGEAVRLLGGSAERIRTTAMSGLLDPWPGQPQRESAARPWRARVRGTREQVRCRVAVFRDSEPARAVLQLVPEKDAEHLEQDEALLQALFSQTKFGLAVHDADLNVTRVSLNAEFRAPHDGLMVEPSGGRPLTETLVAQDAATIAGLLRRVLERGEPLLELPQRARRLDQPLTDRFVSLSAIPLAGSDGRPSGVVATFTDITAEHREKEGRLLTGEAARRIGADLDPVRCAQELVDVLVPAFADAAAVDLAEAVLLGEEPGALRQEAPHRRTAHRGGDGRLLPTGRDGERATMEVELRARGQVLGRVVVGRSPERGAFDSLDEGVAGEIASRTALSIDNARRYVRERRSVEVLRRSLLPSRPEEISAADIGLLHTRAGAAGAGSGAWVDVVPLSSTRVAFTAGRTTGHGIRAAAAAGRLRTAVQTLSDLDLAPEELLTHVDELVRRLARADGLGRSDAGQAGEAGEDEVGGEVGATCLYAVYDPVTGLCAMASAGHHAPLLISADGGTLPVPLVPGPPLGRESTPFETVEFHVEPGSVLILSAGGPAEPVASPPSSDRMTGDPEAVGVLRKVLDDPLAENVVPDGVALAARVRVLPPGSTAYWQFPADPFVVAQAREAVTGSLAAWGLQDMAFVTELVASELVTNAIRYAGGPVGLRLINDRSLICEVSDPSQTQPHLRHARLTDEGGRGLFLVHQLTEQWGSRYTGAGKTIWTAQSIEDATR
ncbi:SpoIIE family protein phosphatase [Kitasatospora sp. NBC_01539]|uniref:SpoIIE family protein phosphatase n=1 Tax=Kitasatospora sp. NBC_01539 TaxID=2903577 RepID=UPI0038602FCA